MSKLIRSLATQIKIIESYPTFQLSKIKNIEQEINEQIKIIESNPLNVIKDIKFINNHHTSTAIIIYHSKNNEMECTDIKH